MGSYLAHLDGKPPVWRSCVAAGSSQQLMLRRGGMCFKSSGAGDHCGVFREMPHSFRQIILKFNVLQRGEYTHA